MAHERSVILRLVTIRNERGVTLLATIILLFFVSLFLFSIVLWHDSLYMNFNSLEVYYENRAENYMNRIIKENGTTISESLDLINTDANPLDDIEMIENF